MSAEIIEIEHLKLTFHIKKCNGIWTVSTFFWSISFCKANFSGICGHFGTFKWFIAVELLFQPKLFPIFHWTPTFLVKFGNFLTLLKVHYHFFLPKFTSILVSSDLKIQIMVIFALVLSKLTILISLSLFKNWCFINSLLVIFEQTCMLLWSLDCVMSAFYPHINFRLFRIISMSSIYC